MRLEPVFISVVAGGLLAGCHSLPSPDLSPEEQFANSRSVKTVMVDCPANVQIQETGDVVSLTFYFGTAACQMNGDHIAAIKEAVQKARELTGTGDLYAMTVGTTDPRGSKAYNEQLGNQRAGALNKALGNRDVKIMHTSSTGEVRADQGNPDNPVARSAYALIGSKTAIQKCWEALKGAVLYPAGDPRQPDACKSGQKVRSALRPD